MNQANALVEKYKTNLDILQHDLNSSKKENISLLEQISENSA
jgi:hypothetical protein